MTLRPKSSAVFPRNRQHRPDGDVQFREMPALAAPSRAEAKVGGRAKRQALAQEAGVLDLAEEIAADSITTVEFMLTEQMAGCHNAALRLITQASLAPTVEAMVKLTNASARMMDTFAQAALTLQRLRGGTRQTVVVQHVQISDGGQAVIAGNVKGGGHHGGQ